ncbi:MAG: WXG100 family type VII secretion target [Actinocatenispora sp.]
MRVDHATLHTAAKDVRSTRDEIQGDLSKLESLVQQDLASAWQGTAAASFQQLMNRWHDDSKTLMQAMADIADLLDKSGTNHEVTDQNQQQMIDKIHSALNG